MKFKLLGVIAQMVSWLPLSANQALGALIGKLFWISNTQPRKITQTNLRLCFPDMPESERQALARNSLIETGRQITECAWIWHRPNDQVMAKIVSVEGQEYLDQAWASPQGLIMVSPHMGNWELCALPLTRSQSFTYFYKSPREEALGNLLIRWRNYLGGRPLKLDATGIRTSLKLLKRGETLGILPDQEPDFQNGVFTPFFAAPALSMTLLPRLANKSGAQILFCVAKRLPRARGWQFIIFPGDARIASDDIAEASTAVNQGVERCVELCPEQYLWDYRRFSTCPDGSRRQYR